MLALSKRVQTGEHHAVQCEKVVWARMNIRGEPVAKDDETLPGRIGGPGSIGDAA